MTACAIEPEAAPEDGAPQPGFTITADGAYAARLALDGGSLFPERWTLDGPEPYAVPLPANQPEEPGAEVQPMGDGRVLIRRATAGRHVFSLLYPTGPGTGEVVIGSVECPDGDTRLRLLPPAPGGERAYALAVGRRSSAVWLVAGGEFGPEHVAQIPGRCSGGVWLDHTGRMLALDREVGGRTKAVVVDLRRDGETSPLLQIADGSDDRLLLADPDSGLLLISSDAPSPGEERLGWGVLGSTLPVRFPEFLRLPECTVTPFAIQPGQVLTPESCGVALRVDGPLGSWVGLWRPDRRHIDHLPAPAGWLTGSGCWTRDGVLQLPYATAEVPCGVARLTVPSAETGKAAGTRKTAEAAEAVEMAEMAESTEMAEAGETAGKAAGTGGPEKPGGRPEGAGSAGPEGPVPSGADARGSAGSSSSSPAPGGPTRPGPSEPVARRPVPLREAPLGRLVTK
ncbi:hypothetical protein [Streptomyces sediminimaris]|uniref:hypothetical protein n=1 Tax=Streptomyces sediminimaris TaxID=3383721 RepID=UPI00399A3658